MSIEQIVVTRYASELVDKTLSTYLSQALGIPSGDIYFHSPDHIFVNDRTETTNNRQELRYPCISVNSKDITLNKVNDYVTEHFSSTTVTGLVEYYVGDYECYHDYELTMYTSSKRDHRRYKEKLIHFFNTYDRGMELVEDSLPNSVKEHMMLLLEDKITDYQDDTPYLSCFNFTTIYRIYKEKSHYLLYNFSISGNIEFNSSDVSSFELTGSLF
jgi:hypothetical protein